MESSPHRRQKGRFSDGKRDQISQIFQLPYTYSQLHAQSLPEILTSFLHTHLPLRASY